MADADTSSKFQIWEKNNIAIVNIGEVWSNLIEKRVLIEFSTNRTAKTCLKDAATAF